MATKLTDKCLQKAADNEPIFVLRAKDELAPLVVRFWAFCAEIHKCDAAKVAEARALAEKMEEWPSRRMPT